MLKGSILDLRKIIESLLKLSEVINGAYINSFNMKNIIIICTEQSFNFSTVKVETVRKVINYHLK